MKTRDKTWPEIVDIILEKNNETKNKKFRAWLESKEYIGYWFDYFLWMHAYGIQKKINSEDNDHFTVVAGMEGSGKSILAMQLAALVSPTFSMKHICFSIHDFLAIIKGAKKGDSIILDEGAIFLFSRETMTKDTRKIVKAFNLIRQLDLHMIICIPNFYHLDTYIRKHRVDSLIQIRRSRDTYRALTKRAIDILNEMERKIKNVMQVKIPYGSFWEGYWSNHYPEINDINEKAYRDKKLKHLNQYIDEMKKQAAIEEELVISMVKVAEFEKVVPLSRDSIVRNIKNKSIPGRRIGQQWYVDGEYYRDVRGFNKDKDKNMSTRGEDNRESTNVSKKSD